MCALSGIKFLADMRADLIKVLHEQPAYGAALRALNEDLRRSLAEWFSVGLLQLQRATWEGSSGDLLEKVMRYEAVHPMSNLMELKQRMGNNRRVFVFFHPSLPGEPLVILHTAITNSIPGDMPSILEEQTVPTQTLASFNTSDQEAQQRDYGPNLDRAAHGDEPLHECADCSVACFYSITSTQPGLSGVDLGNFLIKRVAQVLMSEMPHLQHLVTLSPLPKFSSWLFIRLRQEHAWMLEQQSQSDAPANPSSSGAGSCADTSAASSSSRAPLLLPHELQALQPLFHAAHAQSGAAGELSAASPAAQLLHVLETSRWLHYPDHEPAVQAVLMRLAAVYLVKQRRRNLALDPVANFHLRNGAWLWRMHWRADMSAPGIERSFGIMVNYKYIVQDVNSNNRAYLVEHKVAASPEIQAMADAT
eukprot:jgi/Chrzof1/2323/Cz11g10290.t1